MTLAEDIAELRRQTRADNPWEEADFHDRPRLCAELAAILNAAVSGELVPATDARLAVALVVEKAADAVKDRLWTGTEWVDDLRAYQKVIVFANTDALAEVQKLRDELHLMKTAGIIEVMIRNPSVADYVTHWEGRAGAAEAKVARLETLEGAATVLLRYVTDPAWADRNSEAFRMMPWQELYGECRKDAGDFPAILRTHLEAFSDPEFREELRAAIEGVE